MIQYTSDEIEITKLRREIRGKREWISEERYEWYGGVTWKVCVSPTGYGNNNSVQVLDSDHLAAMAEAHRQVMSKK